MRRLVWAAALAAAVGCGGGGYDDGAPAAACTAATAVATNAVSMPGMAFSPACIRVTAGTTVTWTNSDAVSHTVTRGPPEAFDSGLIAPAGTFQRAFPNAGTFSYQCTIHLGMRGTVIVE